VRKKEEKEEENNKTIMRKSICSAAFAHPPEQPISKLGMNPNQ
jgi:hypothetical protein